MSETERTESDVTGERSDDVTVPAEQTAEGLGDVTIGGETEEDSPRGGAAEEPGGDVPQAG